MTDPLTSLSAPPPRYLLESDSSDEEGQGAYPGSPRRPAARPSLPAISVRLDAPAPPGPTLVLGIGQAGKFLLKHARGRVSGAVATDGRRVGDVLFVGRAVLVLVDEREMTHGAVWAVARVLLDTFRPVSTTVLTTYVPLMYITFTPLGEPPIRYLSSVPRGVDRIGGAEKYSAPNYLSGIAAALMSLSARPHSPPSTTLLLPLPLSSLPLSHLSSALSAISPDIAGALPAKSTWSEGDDEPFVAYGMGSGRSARGAGDAGMYT